MAINQPPISEDPTRSAWEYELTQNINTLEQRLAALESTIGIVEFYTLNEAGMDGDRLTFNPAQGETLIWIGGHNGHEIVSNNTAAFRGIGAGSVRDRRELTLRNTLAGGLAEFTLIRYRR